MKKVMVVVPSLDVGGGESCAVEILRGIHNEELSCMLVSLYPKHDTPLDQRCRESGIRVRYLTKRRGFHPKTLFDLDRLIREYKPDVVHAHLRVMLHLLLPLVRNRVPKRYYTVHNLAERDGGTVGHIVLRLAFRFGKVRPVAISDHCRDSVSSFYHIPREDVLCIYNGFDTGRFTRKDGSLSENGEITFLATGRLAPQKDYPLMIRAFSDALQVRNDIRLLILGSGDEMDALSRLIRACGAEEHIRLLGFQREPETFLSHADVYIMSSDWEGLPLSVLEAMGMGLPIISTKAGGVVDVVENGKNGILVECGDRAGLTEAILRMAASPDFRAACARNNASDSKKYSFTRCAEEYEKLYLR